MDAKIIIYCVIIIQKYCEKFLKYLETLYYNLTLAICVKEHKMKPTEEKKKPPSIADVDEDSSVPISYHITGRI